MLALFLDMSKAFDTVDHKILLQKLKHMGFRGKYSQLFKNYFTGRYQSVRIENAMSRTLPIKNGVPQGSTIGPLLFNIYTNNIDNLSLSSRLYQYADDTALVFEHSSYEHAVEAV